MSSLLPLLGLALAGLALTPLTAQAPREQAGPSTIVDLLGERGEHRQLLRQAKRAAVATALAGEGPITLFAPTDAAFGALPPRSLGNLQGMPDARGFLRRLLLAHAVKGAWTAEKLREVRELRTLAGSRLEIAWENGRLLVNGVPVESADLRAENGLVHAVPLLLMPLAEAAPTAETEALRFPPVEGKSLTRKKFRLPGDLEAGHCLVLVAFAQIHQRSVDTWVPLGKEIEGRYEGFRYYELPTIRRLNPIAQTFIDRGMAAGIPSEDTRSRTITLYTDVPAFLAPLGLKMKDREHIHAFLVTPGGEVLWHARGPLSAAAAEQVRAFAAKTLKRR
jgi:uncharacterized surface protein with fasciclin (FAS1) repeats